MPGIGQHHIRTSPLSESDIRALGPLHIKVRNLLHDAPLSRAEKNVLRALMDHCNKKKWTCWPSASTIAKHADCSVTAMRRARRNLVAKGYVSYEERCKAVGNGWDSTSHLYTIHVDKLVAPQDDSADFQTASGGTTKLLVGTNKTAVWGTSKTVDEVAIREDATEDTILNEASEDASAREDQTNLRPSTENEPTRTTSFDGSDDLAPSRLQTETPPPPPPPPAKRGYQRDASQMMPVTCSFAGCSNMWQVFPQNAKAQMLCPELHLPLLKQQQAHERRRQRRAA